MRDYRKRFPVLTGLIPFKIFAVFFDTRYVGFWFLSWNFIFNKGVLFKNMPSTFRNLILMEIPQQQAFHKLSRPGKYAISVLLQNKILLSLGNKYKV